MSFQTHGCPEWNKLIGLVHRSHFYCVEFNSKCGRNATVDSDVEMQCVQ